MLRAGKQRKAAMATGDQDAGSNSNRRDSTASTRSGALDVTDAVQAKCTHHAPRKRLLTKLQALVTSPKRAYGHAERDGLGAITDALTGRHRRDSTSKEDGQSKYRERLASDASSTSPSSAARLATSPTSSLKHAAFNLSSTKATSPDTLPSPGSPEVPHLTSSAVKREDKFYHSGIVQTNQKAHSASAIPDDLADAARSQPHGAPTARVESAAEGSVEQEILLRPHLKLRVVTWNMHDSLPTGDLTELLGAPSSACDATVKAKHAPYDPDHVVKPLSSGLEHDAPYHLVVVGGQEVPVGYGGWSGPNWTETIHRWLSGSANTSLFHPDYQDRSNETSTLIGDNSEQKTFASPTSPSTAHRQFLDAQSSETLILPEDAVDSHDAATSAPVAPTIEAGRYGQESRELHNGQTSLEFERTTHFLKPGPNLHSNGSVTSTPMAMGRSSSSDTSNTDRSVCTDMKSMASAEENASVVAEADQVAAIPEEAQAPYILVTKERLMGIYCSLWVHRSCAHLVQGSSTGTVTAGLLAGKLGNKGAACISLKIADTRFLFVCAHLAAHSEKSALRQANVRKIKEELVIDTFTEEQEVRDKPRLKRGLSVSRPFMEKDRNDKGLLGALINDDGQKRRSSRIGQDITDLFDHTFWFGDLNFRLDISRLHADFLIKEKKFDTALTFDQLRPILKDSSGCFGRFQEAPIKFAPSYKYDVLKLKRSRTVQRTPSTTAGLGLTIGERRGQANSLTSPPAPVSLNTSRTNLTADVVDEENEEDEEDNNSIADRVTVGSSRASISSTYSGFERSLARNDDLPDQETLANTHYNHRVSTGLFASSIPSTPTTDRFIEKAKGFFHHMRARSPVPAPADSEARPSISLSTGPFQNRHTDPDPNLLSPIGIASACTDGKPDVAHHGPHADTPITDRPSMDDTSQRIGTSLATSTDDNKFRRLSNDISAADRSHTNIVTRSTTPILSPRPRLKSMRSSNTVLSMSSIGFAKSVSSSGQEQLAHDTATQDGTYDTSSKKRVQSWTDRILYKSNVDIVEDENEETEGHRSLLSGTLVPALRSMSRSVRDYQEKQTHNRTASRTTPTLAEAPQRISFQTTASSPNTNDDGNDHSETYQRQNSSTTSLPGTQQRLNGRIAGLFRRRSSGKRINDHLDDTPQIHPVVVDTAESPSEGFRAPSFGHRKLVRSSSTRSHHRNPVDDTDRRPEIVTIESPAFHDGSASSDALSLLSRTKPFRSYTSPLPEKPPSETPQLAVRKQPAIQVSQAFKPSQARGNFSPVTSAPRLSEQNTQLASSTSMLRHGSEPLSVATADSVDTLSRSTSCDHPAAGGTDGAGPSRIPFSMVNPFSRFYHKEEPPMASIAEAQVANDLEHISTKTGLTIPSSKTTPVSGESAHPNERHHLGLRQWWNARMLPHIFTSHFDSQTPDTSDAKAENEVPPVEQPEVAPKPIIAGPRRGEVLCIHYDSVSDLRRMEACSDHRPVVAVFAIGV